MAQSNRRLYQGSYTTTLDEPDTQTSDPASAGATTETDPDTAEEKMWKKRYGDLRSHNNGLTERISSLEAQLQAASKKEITIPSSPEQLQVFMQKYPDVYRDVRSIVLKELLSEKDNLKQETQQVKDDLSQTRRELGLAKILQAHPDFHEVNLSQHFQDWADIQPTQIQDWLFNSDDPKLCIKALDLYKAETNYKKSKQVVKTPGADMQVGNPKAPEITGGNKRIWTASEIGKMHPREYEKFEDEIDLARVEGRFNPDA